MRNEPFDPKRVVVYDDLPETVRHEFRPVQGGFVRRTAIEDCDRAVEEAHVLWNQMTLSDLIAERAKDLKLTVDVTREVLRGENSAGQEALDGQRDAHQAALDNLPSQAEWIKAVIARYRIADVIDMEFVEDLASFCELWGPEALEAPATKHEGEYVANAIARLKLRRRRLEYERRGEEEYVIPLSGDRTMRVLVAEDRRGARLLFTPFTDFTRVPVQIGPEAVVTVLGGRLTADDYRRIAMELVGIAGSVGEACRSYGDATRAWAIRRTAGEADQDLRWTRQEAAWEVQRVFGSRDSKMAPLTDVPVIAISVLVLQEFPGLLGDSVPQPFER